MTFNQWFEQYERDCGELMLYNTIDLEAAFNAGLNRAAEIAEGCWGNSESVARAIREEIG